MRDARRGGAVSSDVLGILAQLQSLLRELSEALSQTELVPSPKNAAICPQAVSHDQASDQVYFAPPLTYRVRGGITLAIDGEKPHWLTTNATGAAILRGCSGTNTVADIAEGLSRRFGIAGDIALADTIAFLETLEGTGFVRQSPSLAPQYRGRSSALSLGRLADMYLFVTNDCNLRCSHCYVSSGDYVPAREMRADEILGLVDQARDLGVQRFLITGGEPFVMADIFSIIGHITAENDLVVLTNGMFFSQKIIGRLKESLGRGRISFQISLDGPTAELHDRVRGQGNFAKTVPAIRRIVEHGFGVTISTAINRHNLSHVAETTQLVGSLGVRAHHLLWMQEWGRALDHRPELLVSPQQVVEVMRACRKAGHDAGVVIDNDASLRVRVKGKYGRKTDLCSCGWDTLAVFSDGQVYPCVWLAGAPGMACGSVLEQPLADIWRHSPVLEEIRGISVQNKDKCAGCHLKFICAGGSPCSSHFASLANQGKSDLRAAEPYCQTFMDLTHDMLWELGLAGVSETAAAGKYVAPRVYNAMDSAGSLCARPNTRAVDRAFEVGSYHCVCVLESDVQEGAPVATKIPADGADPLEPAASFDAIGRACVELLLPMANEVRALKAGQVLKVTTDDPAAREDLSSWCRMSGNELAGRIKGNGFEHYYIRRGYGP
jgi:radical SAM protein with 4Fe4S-binding SPASM domain